MTAETKHALDEAIAAHAASEAEVTGVVVTGYALVVSCSSAADFDDEVTRYLFEYAEGQPFHVGLGLVHRHRMNLERDSAR